MLDGETRWLETRFTELRDGVHARIDEIEAEALHQRQHAARKLDALLRGIHHLISRGTDMNDHDSILSDLKTFSADLDSAADQAVSEFNKLEAQHDAKAVKLDDIGAIVADLPSKLDRLKALQAPAEAAPSAGINPPAPVEVTVAAPTTAPTVTIPVSAEVAANTAVGSVVTGPGIPDGATVIGTTDNHPQTGGPALTIDDATTADHAVGDSITVAAPVAQG